MNEKQLTTELMEHIYMVLESLNSQVNHIESFLLSNFRQYNGRYNNAQYHLAGVRGTINELKQLTATNADNVHRLEQVEEPRQQVAQQAPWIYEANMPSF